MNVLVLGSGGREHALAWRLAQSQIVSNLLALPGNAGIEDVATCIPGNPMDFDAVLSVCRHHQIDLVVVGPESPLIGGIADFLESNEIKVFGPRRNCAQIEGSKVFSKQLMRELGVPTAPFRAFDRPEDAIQYINQSFDEELGIVVKADGEAVGKGVVVAASRAEAEAAVRSFMVDRLYGDSGIRIVVESRLKGRELSLIAVCSGEDYRLFPLVQDHKRAYDHDTGPNTGGMGAVSPLNWMPDTMADHLAAQFIRPVLRHFATMGTPYCGALFAGIMMTNEGPYCLEYNCRFGDPETQAALLRIESDFGVLLLEAASGKPLSALSYSNDASVVIVIAAKGYPGAYDKGIPIPTLTGEQVTVFHAGTKRTAETVESTGGRVLNICAKAPSVNFAAKLAYNCISKHFGPRWHFRNDIGAA